MNKARATLKRFFITIVALIQVLGLLFTGLPRLAWAQEAVPPPVCPAVNGTDAPTGASSHTFTFRPADAEPPTCIWENDYYYWNPATKVYTPKYDTHVCDQATNICENVDWVYITSDGKYVERRTVVSAPATTNSGNTDSSEAGTGNGASSQSSGSSIVSGNGANSSNSINNSSDTDVDIDLTNDASVLLTLDSNATSGDATALLNTTVGNVSTGSATTMANILNMIQSSWNPENGDINLFSADLFNDYFGDLMFDPSIFLGNGANSTNLVVEDNDLDLTLNVENDASIENNINLNAQSGDATANGNTTVGDVSTGDATAVANVINMINSMITAGNSFIGSINLHGSLNGDILLPPSLLEILLGNGSGSSNTIANNQETDVDADTHTNSSITNNTNLTANSGNALAVSNTTVGDISTGNATTSVNEMNLVGQNLQGTGGLMVFVNVAGSWVGMLLGGSGTTSILGGNGANSTNNISNNTDLNADIDINNDYSIVNNLNLNASSGNATASRNTTVGDVSTGNASSAVNLLNMIDSQVTMSDWFGVLFINVFGAWNGSFGVDTASGDPPPVVPSSSGTPPADSPSESLAPSSSVSRSSSVNSNRSARLAGIVVNQADVEEDQVLAVATLADASISGSGGSEGSGASGGSRGESGSSIWLVSGITTLVGILLLGSERLLALLRKTQV